MTIPTRMRPAEPPARLRVGFDLDGCVVEFSATLAKYLVEIHHWKADRCPLGRRWEFYLDWGLTLEEFVALADDAADAGYLFMGPPEPGAVAAIRQVKDDGHEVHILTDRTFGATPKVSQYLTYQWLAEHAVPYDSVTFTADKTVVELDVMCEDKPSNYQALRAVGTRCFLIDRPWNHRTDAWRDALIRDDLVTSVRAYVDQVLAEQRAGYYVALR